VLKASKPKVSLRILSQKNRPTEVSLLEQIFSWSGFDIDRLKASSCRTSLRPPNVSALLPQYVCELRPTSLVFWSVHPLLVCLLFPEDARGV
jgi:hypothetical protein